MKRLTKIIMIRHRFLHLLTVVAALYLSSVLIACGGATETTQYQDLVLRIQTNRTTARIGEEVQVHFTVTNTGKQPVQINSENEPAMDVRVYDAGSEELFVSWAALHPDQAAKTLVWQPGETKTVDVQWTPTEKEYYISRPIYLSGYLREDSKIVQDASLLICLGGCDR